jgi:hypothetical protein
MICKCIFVAMFLFANACSTSITNEPVTQHAVETTDATMFESPWVFEGDEGVRYVSDVWDIRTTIKYEHILESLPPFYDALIERYTTVFGVLPYPKEKMDVFLFASEEQWQSKLSQMLGKEAEHWFQLKSGGVTIDGIAVLYHLDRRGRSRVTLRIAAHEGWHQYAEAAFVSCLPTWLDEGIGTWMEGFRIRRGEVQFLPASNWDRLTTLREIINAGRMSSLNVLMQSDPSTLLSTGRTTLLGYYAQLWGLVSFIIEYEDGKYMPALRTLLQEAAIGAIREPSKGWLSYFSTDQVLFEKEYNKWVVQYVRPGSSWR